MLELMKCSSLGVRSHTDNAFALQFVSASQLVEVVYVALIGTDQSHYAGRLERCVCPLISFNRHTGSPGFAFKIEDSAHAERCMSQQQP